MDEREGYPTLRRVLTITCLAGLVLAGLGYALGGGSQSNLGGTLKGVVNAAAPQITNFDLNTIGVGNWSQNGKAISVLTTYQLVATVNAPNGWTNVSKMYFDLWYDNGSASLTFAGQTAGKNYKLNISYSNPAQLSSPFLSNWTVDATTGGNVNYLSANSWIRTNVANQNYSFGIAFQLHAQVHRAATPSTPSNSGYTNLRTWNAHFGVQNTTGAVFWKQTNTTGFYLEVGVNQYTSFTSSAPTWTISGIAPGASAQTNTVAIVYTSNGNYSFNVTLTSVLKSGSNTIPANKVAVYGGTVVGPPGTAYAGVGSANTIYLLGGAAVFILQSASADSLTISITFTITVPLGTPTGTYTAPIVLSVNQSASP